MAKAKLKLGYDNYDDAQKKLVGTYCMIGDRAVTIKNLYPKDEAKPNDGKYVVYATPMIGRAQLPKTDIDSQKFNCSEFNIGYMNANGYADWFYRMPYKQWRQGLRGEQMGVRSSIPGLGYGGWKHMEFRAGSPLGHMMENKYPDFEKVAKTLHDDENTHVMAFHRNFAMSRDHIHGDYIFEYKGQPIGFTPNLVDLKLIREHEHLYEALKEAIG